MSYIINKYTGAAIATVEDGTIDQTLDITLIGKNYAGYGEIQNENFLFLLENFSGVSSPPKAISGQVWFDSSKNKLKYYTGDKWKSTGGAEVSATPPTGLSEGDFWWDTSALQVKIYDGTDYVLIGPQRAGSGTTLMRSRIVKDDQGEYHSIIEAVINDIVTYIISYDEFTLDSVENPVEGFTWISAGLTLVKVNEDGISNNAYTPGYTLPVYYWWGTASDSLKLGGTDASEFLKEPVYFHQSVKFSDLGYVLGDDEDLHVYIQSGDIPVIENQLGNSISFRVKDTTQKEIFLVRETGILPGTTLTYNLGSASLNWNTVYADRLEGVASKAETLKLNSSYLSASADKTPSTVVVRNELGNVYAEYFYGVAIQAQYADLAEIYEADDEYGVGTVVVIGGEKEITTTNVKDDYRVLGAISQNPAYLMNSESDGLPVALKGKVNIKVVGPVRKGDKLVTSNIPGVAIVKNDGINWFAKSLENSNETEVRLVKSVVIG